MTHRSRPTPRLLRQGAVLALLALVSPAVAQPAAPVFGCDAAGGRTCYFTVLTGSGPQSFSLTPGQRRAVAGLTPRKDVYVVSYGAANLGDLGRCRRMAALSRGCDRKMVDPNYND
jgi:hypothetical protein